MNRRLDGVNPLAYMGVKPSTPTQMVVNKDRRPTSTDLQNFQLGTWWLIPTRSSSPTNEVWILINKTASTATWIELNSGGGSVVPGAQYTLLTSDGSGGYGTNVGPGTAGQVLLSGGGASNPDFITPTATTPLVVTANASTFDYSISISNHALIVGDGANGVTEIAPHATSGVPLVSKGASADPDYGTAVVSGGGTAKTSFTAYSVICGGTTSTGALQNVSGVGTSGQVLTSNGAGMLPTWQSSGGSGTFSSIVVQTFTSNGTYTPTSGMQYCIVEIVGGGGGSGGRGRPSSPAGNYTNIEGGGGGASGYCKSLFDAATIGASQPVVIGAAGTAGTDGVAQPSIGGTGGTGGDSTFGSGGILMTASGGEGAIGTGSDGSAIKFRPGGAGGNATGGNIINVKGEPGGVGMKGSGNFGSGNINIFTRGNGGSTPFGRGGMGTSAGYGNATNFFNASGYGSGGLGNTSGQGGSTAGVSAPGMPGICIITEFVE